MHVTNVSKQSALFRTYVFGLLYKGHAAPALGQNIAPCTRNGGKGVDGGPKARTPRASSLTKNAKWEVITGSMGE